ncbi:MAG TPA: YicC/YloC family endoribonuclease [Burkholderiales bacterium]|nr:YicC/YloC family endoribonuclease [Burkholderiales bacterium]
MTGYAASAREYPFGALSIELRSVNHRYLDIQFRLPDDLRALEPTLRELLNEHIARGKVECRVAFSAVPGAHKTLKLNEELLQQLQALEHTVRGRIAGATPLTAADLLRWPGVLATEPVPQEELQAACREVLARVIDDFNAARAREGERLLALLKERAAGMERVLGELTPRIPQVVAAYQDKLAARLKEAIGGGEEERIRQEVAVFATKIDVDEELSRLAAHVAELKRVLGGGGAVGKKLDFLMQELNREANTLASKSVDLAVTRAALEMKIVIEQMREQIQNIE